MDHMTKIYLAGPMQGIPRFNFPAFEDAARDLRKSGFHVVSPHELDNSEIRVQAEASPDGKADGKWGEYLARDLKIITDEGIEAIVVLPGWVKSKGAKAETYLAKLLKIPVFEFPDLRVVFHDELDVAHTSVAFVEVDPMPECGPLEKAAPLVKRDRQDVYGHPIVDFTRTAAIWNALFGWDVAPSDVPLAMIGVKLSRLRQTPDHEDSMTDVAGYIETYWMVKEKEKNDTAT